eukprot:COSAG01_NODE_29391_length_639_cov_0.622222_2_plen_52_part_01
MRQWKTEIGFEIMSHTGDVSGVVHRWFKWGENKITGENRGGSPFGVVIIRLT